MRTRSILRSACILCTLFCIPRVSQGQQARVQTSPATLATVAASGVGIRADSVPANHPPVADTFIGSDKVKHFLMSGFLEAVGFSALQFAGASRSASIAGATAVAAAAGVGREIHDGRTKRLFSLGDLAWDTMGIASALLLISHTQR